MRIALISDIHENTEALKEALRAASFCGCDEIACLGDIVGFDTRFYNHTVLRSAKECVRMVRSNCRWIVAGNHDLHAAGKIPAWSNGFTYPGNWFSLDSAGRKLLSNGRVWCYESEAEHDLGPEESGFLSDLPEYLVVETTETTLLLSHYILPDATGSTTIYAERNNQLREQWDFMNNKNIKVSFIGHSHSSMPGFAYPGRPGILKAFNTFPNDLFYLGSQPTVVMLLPLTGDKGRTGFAILDTGSMQLKIVNQST